MAHEETDEQVLNSMDSESTNPIPVIALKTGEAMETAARAAQLAAIKLYERVGLPTRIPDYIDREALVKKLYTDKKVRDGKLRFVIEKGIGDVVEFAPNVYAKPIEESLAREIIMEL